MTVTVGIGKLEESRGDGGGLFICICGLAVGEEMTK